MSAWQERIQALGISVVGITYDPVVHQSRFVRKHEISYPMLSDPDSTAIRQLGLLNEEIDPSTRYYGVPYPGVFLLDSESRVVAKFAERDYRDRPLMDDIFAAAKHLTGTSPSTR